MKSTKTAMIIGSLILITMVVSAHAGAQDGKGVAVYGGQKVAAKELIVSFGPKAGSNTKSYVHGQMGANVKRSFNLINADYVRIPDWMTIPEAIEVYSRFASVKMVEPNYQLVTSDVTTAATPNDPSYSNLWGLHNTGQYIGGYGTNDADIDAPEAWDVTTGSSSVIVAVIDTGIDYNHPDLAPNMWVNAAELNGSPNYDDDGNGYIDDIYGINAETLVTAENGDPWDDNGHGTHCAGTIGAKGNNGTGIVGVNWNVQLMALKFLDSGGSGYNADAIACIEYAADNGADVISASWGGYGGSEGSALQLAIEEYGKLFVAAAGNDGVSTDVWAHYPSAYSSSNILAVASTTNTDSMSGFSNYGATTVDIGAPGSNIYSTVPDNSYTYYSGTSMATPHVAGAAALVLSQEPGLSAAELKQRLMDSGDPNSALNGKTVSGKRLNVANAVLFEQDPEIVGVTPASGTGQSQLFEATYRDMNGADDFNKVFILVNESVNTYDSVYAFYNVSANELYLRNDASSDWFTGTPGTSTVLSNSQVSIDLSQVSTSQSGTDFVLSIPMEFSPSYAGNHNIYLSAQDNNKVSTGWEDHGDWTVPQTMDPISAVSVTPDSGSGEQQTFTASFQDVDGGEDIKKMFLLINESVNTYDSAYIFYLAKNNTLYLRNDASSGWFSGTPGQSGTISNSQVSIDLSQVQITINGLTAELTVPLTFSQAYAGDHNIFISAQDYAGTSTDWQQMGSWTVPQTIAPLSASSVTPETGSGLSQTFSARFQDVDGGEDIKKMFLLINESVNTYDSVYVFYLAKNNTLYLRNDASSGWFSGVPGQAAVLSNSQVSIDLSQVSVEINGTYATLNVPMVFSESYSGNHNIFMSAQDYDGTSTGWQDMGDWTVPLSGLPLEAVGVTPDSGSGSSQTFTATFKDIDGADDIKKMFILVNESVNTYDSVYVFYLAKNNTLYLRNDASSGWFSGVPGQTGTLSNSQVSIDLSQVLINKAGQTATLTVPMTFTPSYAGTHNIFISTQDYSGDSTGWVDVGTWTVP